MYPAIFVITSELSSSKTLSDTSYFINHFITFILARHSQVAGPPSKSLYPSLLVSGKIKSALYLVLLSG